MYALFNIWNEGQLHEDLKDQEVLIVNRKNNMIVGKVKIMKPPKKYECVETYYLPRKDKK